MEVAAEDGQRRRSRGTHNNSEGKAGRRGGCWRWLRGSCPRLSHQIDGGLWNSGNRLIGRHPCDLGQIARFVLYDDRWGPPRTRWEGQGKTGAAQRAVAISVPRRVSGARPSSQLPASTRVASSGHCSPVLPARPSRLLIRQSEQRRTPSPTPRAPWPCSPHRVPEVVLWAVRPPLLPRIPPLPPPLLLCWRRTAAPATPTAQPHTRRKSSG